MSKKKIVCLGGGTGTFTVLSGLKKYPLDLTAIVNMTDSGGSNRIIRDELGLLPTSDIRQCFVALAEDKDSSGQILRKLFTYRFSKGKGLRGMTFGNLFMAALADIFNSQIEAIRKTSQILKIKGRILPVTLEKSNLAAVYEDGKTVIGEHFIDEPKHKSNLKIKKVYLRPQAKAYPEAIKAIREADLVVIGPGDFYTSLVANLAVKGISEALKKTRAKIVYILNLMTRYGQTDGFGAKDHIRVLEKYLGGKVLDFLLVNSKPIPRQSLKKYRKEREFAVFDDLGDDYFKTIRADLLSKKETKRVAGDVLKRSLIRHDSDKLAKAIYKLCRPR